MAKTKQGDLLSCSACGLVVIVDEICGCDETVLVCCDQPMAKGRVAADKAKKKAHAKPVMSAVKAVKAGGAAKAKIAPPKPAAKKAPAKPAKPAAKAPKK